MDKMTAHIISIQTRLIESLALALKEIDPQAYKKYGEFARNAINQYADDNPDIKQYIEECKKDGRLPNF
jgi:hypothetical protein